MTATSSTAAVTAVPAQAHETYKGLPIYQSGSVPDNLLTARQLDAARRKQTPGQKPRAYLHCNIRHTGWTLVDLYHVEDTRAARPLSPRQEAQKLARRTCLMCDTVAEHPLPRHRRQYLPWLPVVSGPVCAPCDNAATSRRQRTCLRCRTEFHQSRSVSYGYCDACSEECKRGEELAYRLIRRHCPDCTVQTATREEIEAADAANDFLRQVRFPRVCDECRETQRQRAEESRRAGERERWEELGPVRQWARRVIAAPHEFAILDTETTGLGMDAKIVEISVTDGAGNMLLDTLVHPGVPIPEEATAIHGITDEDVQDSGRFGAILPRLTKALEGRRIIIYNQEYDTGVLAYELDRHHREHSPILTGLEPARGGDRHPAAAEWMGIQQWDRCAMLAYAVHAGDWSDYWGGWSWQRLGGGHRALGDCRAVAERIREMAERPDPF